MNKKERTLDEVLDELGECTLELGGHKAALGNYFPALFGEARTIGEKMQAEIDFLHRAVDSYLQHVEKRQVADLEAADGMLHNNPDKKAAVDGRTFKEILNDMICINSLVGTGEGANRMRKNIEIVRTRGEKMQVEYRKLDEKWKTARKAIDEHERGDKVQREHEEMKNRLDIADAYRPGPDIEKRCDAMFANRNDGRIHFPGREENDQYPVRVLIAIHDDSIEADRIEIVGVVETQARAEARRETHRKYVSVVKHSPEPRYAIRDATLFVAQEEYIDRYKFNRNDIHAACDACRSNALAGNKSTEYSRHTTYLKDGNYISFPVVISGTKRGDVKIPVIGHGRDEQGSYITLKLGSLSFHLPIDFDVEKLGG